MIRFFKKNKINTPKKMKIENEVLNFLKKIIGVLPNKYKYLESQINKNFIIYKSPMLFQEKGNISFDLDEVLFNKYKKIDYPELSKIRNIKIKNKKTNEYEKITIRLLNGVLWGYYLNPNTSFKDLNYNDYSIENIELVLYSNEDKKIVSKLLDLNKRSKDFLLFFDIDDTFSVEIPEGTFYIIKNLGDGNFISIDKKGIIYKMTHDPYLIKKIYNNPHDLIDDFESGKLKW